jgi:tellurite resistance protein TerC
MRRWWQWAPRHRRQALSLRTAVGRSLGWIAVSLGFGLLVWAWRGSDAATRFFTAWLLEKSLSFDNLLVFLLLFGRLRVPVAERPRVLGWGIVGAVVLRGLMIAAGLGLIRLWQPVLYAFGAFLAYSGVRTLVRGDEDAPEHRWVGALRRRLHLPPLLFAIVVIELADVLFAVDSIPAVLGVTNDVFLVASSNLLAVLGLRALYFVVERLLARMRYLRFGIGAILILVGARMCLDHVLHVPPLVALSVTAGILVATAVASLVTPPPAATSPSPR